MHSCDAPAELVATFGKPRAARPAHRPGAGHARDRRPWLTVLAASFGFALIQLDVTIVNVALPTIAASLRTGTAGLQWVVDSYAVLFAALLLSAGCLGDRYGSRRIYLGGLALFAAASIACGLAPTAATLVAGRALQGLGAAAMLPCSLALVNHAAAGDAKFRAKAVGWWTASGSITIAAGPIVGGMLMAAFGWRSIFLVNLPVCALGGLLAYRVTETDRQQDKARGLDLPGQALGVIALAALTGAVIEARPQGLASATVLALAAAGCLCATGFIRREARTAAPMVDLRLFRNRAVTGAVIFGCLMNLTYYGMVFLLSLYLQRTLGYRPVRAGLAYLPLTASLFAVNIISGSWVGHHGARWPMVIGPLIDAAGFVLLLPLGQGSSYAAMLPAFFFIPAGLGLGVPAMTSLVLSSVEKQMSGLASGILNAARQAGGAVGVALFGTLAGGDIVRGVHCSALIAAGLLVMASGLGFAATRAMRGVSARR